MDRHLYSGVVSRHKTRPRTVLAGAMMALAVLAGCEEGQLPDFLTPKDDAEKAAPKAASGEVIERDVEAPEVFSVSEAGLWDGRPSLGGVWVAHPDTKEPERVIIRNEANGRFVIGSLFRREFDAVGPRLQVSSDAAQALGLLAGAPVEINVIALRRETVEVAPEPAAAEDAPTEEMAPPEAVATAQLDDPIASAAAAIDAAPEATSPAPQGAEADVAAATLEDARPEAAAETPAPTPVAAPASVLAKPFIQIGIFNIEANARRTADRFRSEGIVPQVLQGESQGKTFWRVIIGPAPDSGTRGSLLSTAKELGFSDAYFVTN